MPKPVPGTDADDRVLGIEHFESDVACGSGAPVMTDLQRVDVGDGARPHECVQHGRLGIAGQQDGRTESLGDKHDAAVVALFPAARLRPQGSQSPLSARQFVACLDPVRRVGSAGRDRFAPVLGGGLLRGTPVEDRCAHNARQTLKSGCMVSVLVRDHDRVEVTDAVTCERLAERYR